MKEATSSNTPFTEGMSDIEGAALVDGFGVANKPVLPIATTWLDATPSGLLRRQTDQSLDSLGG